MCGYSGEDTGLCKGEGGYRVPPGHVVYSTKNGRIQDLEKGVAWIARPQNNKDDKLSLIRSGGIKWSGKIGLVVCDYTQ